MQGFVIKGDQELKVTAEDAALILDSLATQPFNRVNALIGKIVGQINYNMKMEQDGSVPRGANGNAEPEVQSTS